MVIFHLQGANKGEYTIASEKVEMVWSSISLYSIYNHQYKQKKITC